MQENHYSQAYVDQLQNQIADLRQSVSQLDALNTLARHIGAAENLKETNKILVREALRMIDAEQGVVMLLEEDNQTFQTLFRTSYNQPDNIAYRPDPLLVGWMITHKKPLRIITGSDEKPELDIPWHPNIRSFLCVPLLVKNRIIGIISLYNKKTEQGFSRDDEKLLYIIAIQSAQVLETLSLREKNLEITQSKLEETQEFLSKAQEQLIHSEKMAALGQLTAGIAHEIQNPLNFINNFSQLIEDHINEFDALLTRIVGRLEPQDADETRVLLEEIKQGAAHITKHGRRADAIIKSMVAHARTGKGAWQNVDINDLLDSFLNLATNTFEKKGYALSVQVNRLYDKSIERIRVNPQEIGQVVLNIIDNAFYSMYQKHLEKQDASYIPSMLVRTRKGKYEVEIRFLDNGNGIPDHIADKIFEPFFTTKPTGVGTGLGLSLSHEIITKGHGGTFSFEKNSEGGALFIIKIPLD